ncbi:ABC transporter ATP-binding protein [Granulicella sp. dw_53]|uniref:ABC transporter ATP-binding protein n=1 Tax=Granulicella sp. dw_53 TaxID=2719792 RepID=UPI001BD55905|nr:ABC transporter ATP-binding protein [Granulicella sp. dw_53]
MKFSFGFSRLGRALNFLDRPLRDRGQGKARGSGASWSSPKLASVMPEVWHLVGPLRWSLVGSFLLMIVNRFCSFAVPISSRYLINNVMYQRHFDKLPLIVCSVAGATCIQGITTYVLSQRLSITGQRLIAKLRMQVQQHVGGLPVSFYDSNRTGTLATRIMTDVEGVRNLVGAGFLDLAGGVLTALIALIILVRISALMTILTFCILIAFGWFLKRAFGVTRPMFRERSRINAEVTGRLTESLGAVRVVKGYHAEDTEAQVFAIGVGRLLENMIGSISAQSSMSLCSTVVIGVVGGLVMYVGAREVMVHRLDVGGYVEFTMLLAFMAAPVALLVSIGTQLTEALAGLDRTSEILKHSREDSEPGRRQVLNPIQGAVAFENVAFAYMTDKPVLHDISFTSKPGTITALVGSSGSGKSTIISLICGFHNAVGGKVLIDGIDLTTVKLSNYRQQLGIVLQDTFLFDGSIRENVLFSRPQATKEQLLVACRIARVDEFAERLPQQYETIVGERGVKLSGGQRQRLSIARAVLADPRILILDEATSSLDSETEALIQDGLNFLMEGRTTFVIAHRLSTIRRADQILVIENGRIVERGTHHSLYMRQGRYYDLYTRQHGLETNLFLAPGEGDHLTDSESLSHAYSDNIFSQGIK